MITTYGRMAMLLMAGVAAAPMAAQAQTSGGADTVEEVVVTARRVEESLQTTPVAVTALSSAAIERAQINDQVGLQRTTPGLVVATGSPGNSGFSYVSIRGQATVNPGVSNDTAIGIYVDGVYIPRPSQGVSKLIDLQRVEVLRGPQGTLFGRNTTGGAINILTNDPTNEFEGRAQAAIGNYDYWDAGIVLNAPLADGLAARVVFDHQEHSGYGRFPFLNNRDAGDEDSDFASAKLRYDPGGAFDITLAADYNKRTDHGQLQTLGAVDPNGTAASAALSAAFGAPVDLSPIYQLMVPFVHTKDNWYDVFSSEGFAAGSVPNGGRLPYNFLEAYGGSATINVDLDGVQLKSISGYRYSDSNGLNDLDTTPVDLLVTRSGYSSKQFSQEFQLSGDIGDRFNYITGLYYSHETGREFAEFQTFAFINTLFGLPQQVHLNDASIKNVSTGAFAQANYKLTDRLRATAGLRWTWDTRKAVLRNLLDVATAPDAPGNCVNPTNDQAGVCVLTRKAKFDYPAYTFGLDYQVNDDLFVYAKTSRASHAGGWNLRQGSELAPAFRPEKAEDVEAGFKYTTPDRRFRLNAAAFHTWTSDVQRNEAGVVNGRSTTFVVNAGKTRIYGAEFEATLLPIENLELTANLALMRGHYKNGTFLEEPAPGLVVDRSEEPLPQLPRTQFNLGATYTIPAAVGLVTLHADYAYVSAQYYGSGTPYFFLPPELQAQQALQTQFARYKGYGLVNGRATLDVGDSGLQIEVFGRNILDKKYNAHTFGELYGALGISTHYPGEPATYGVGVRYKFGAR